MIIATAGHVDHGKTHLLRALTGTDTAHLPEEKQRGMTIDLGYAYLPLKEGRVLGFIDVPGHEKFLANMLVGMSGVQHALLVVACDDGVMPQTQEHLHILYLLGIARLTVALTKVDKVDVKRVHQVEQQVRNELAGYSGFNAAFFHTSAVTGEGIDELRRYLQGQPASSGPIERRFRLAIDRVFNIKGAGLVVTGSALSGQVQVGDTLWLSGAAQKVRVRGLHSQNMPVQRAEAGERIALNISGNIEKQQIARGDWLLHSEPPQTNERVIVALSGHNTLKQWQAVQCHHAASRVSGHISLLQDKAYTTHEYRLAELVMAQPLYLVENDNLILRDQGSGQILAGARVLLLNPPRRGKRQALYLAWLQALSQANTDQQILALHCLQGAIALTDFSWARQLTQSGLDALVADASLLRVGQWALACTLAQTYQQKLLAVVAQEHQQHPDQQGISRAKLRRMALPWVVEPLVFTLVDQLVANDELKNSRGWLHLPQHSADFTEAQRQLWFAIERCLDDEAGWVRDIAQQTETEEQTVRELLKCAARLGYVVAIVHDRYYLTRRIQQFAALIRAQAEEKKGTSAADFRDKLGVGRKLAVQILEFFDRSGFTRRQGNIHLLRDEELF